MHSNTRVCGQSQDTSNSNKDSGMQTLEWQTGRKMATFPQPLDFVTVSHSAGIPSCFMQYHSLSGKSHSWCHSPVQSFVLWKALWAPSWWLTETHSMHQLHLSWLGLTLGAGAANRNGKAVFLYLGEAMFDALRTWACHKGSRNLLPWVPRKLLCSQL